MVEGSRSLGVVSLESMSCSLSLSVMCPVCHEPSYFALHHGHSCRNVMSYYTRAQKEHT